jgi:hypothetical protein
MGVSKVLFFPGRKEGRKQEEEAAVQSKTTLDFTSSKKKSQNPNQKK